MAVIAVLSVELTLKWNGVSGVNEVQSTGQVIPLIAGLSVLIYVFWKVYQQRVRDIRIR